LSLEAAMTRKTQRAELRISDQERADLERLAGSRTAPRREIERAKILLRYASGEGISAIQQVLGISRPTIYKCVDKALATGMPSGLKDRYHRSHEPVITAAAKAWVTDLACTKPCDRGLAAELWTLSELARFVREQSVAAGHSCLTQAGKATVWRILNAQALKPHKI
jgi:transposase